MDAAAILDGLTNAKGMPHEALAAATEQRAEMTPLFLIEIDAWLDAVPENRAEESPLFFIFHLLGSWGETIAYRSLARFLRCPGDGVEEMLGDASTETSHRVMASMFDGDPEPLYGVILDPEADEYIRARMFDTLAMVTTWGKLDRAETSRFLDEAYRTMMPQAESFLWEGWQGAIALLGLSELREQVRSAYQRGFIPMELSEFSDFESDLALTLDSPDQVINGPGELYLPFGDVAAEMEDWEFAKNPDMDEVDVEDDRFLAELGADLQSGLAMSHYQPFLNALKDVGRNDPCPCDSGKKFKKCCAR
jgi:hypothetical protein